MLLHMAVQQKKQLFENLQVINKSEQTKSRDIFHTPMVLVDNESGKPVCDLDTIAELSKIEKTLNIVSIVGTYRSGKSSLLNIIAPSDKDGRFQTGHTTTPVTKGIWVRCRPHPTQNDQVLVLLDTEGFDDPKAVDVLDGCVFILTTLLSSTLVYNTNKDWDRSVIQKFEFLAGLKTSITVSGSDMDDSILDFFFPTFVLCLRDVTLDITQESDQFLEENLELQNGTTDNICKYNHLRQLIRRYYKRRKCFRFGKPTKRKRLSVLMEIPEDELKEGFQETLNTFRDYVFSCPPKTLKCGKGVNGRMFCTLLLSYVNSIKDDQPPNIEIAMQTMAKDENAHAIQKAADFYATEMKQKLAKYDTPNETGLILFHTDSLNAAIAILKSELVFDDKQIYEEEATSLIKEHLKKFKNTVDRNSVSICKQRLMQLDMRISQKMKTDAYHHSLGYNEYMTDIEWIVTQYRKTKILGTQGEACLQEFLEDKKSEEETVYQWAIEASNEQIDTETESEPHVQRMSTATIIEEMHVGQDKDLNRTDLENIESEISKNIQSIQDDGKKRIKAQYLEMLQMKIEELERMRKEVSEDDPMFKQLQKDTEFWKELLKNASWNLPKYTTNGEQQKQERKGKCLIM